MTNSTFTAASSTAPLTSANSLVRLQHDGVSTRAAVIHVSQVAKKEHVMSRRN